MDGLVRCLNLHDLTQIFNRPTGPGPFRMVWTPWLVVIINHIMLHHLQFTLLDSSLHNRHSFCFPYFFLILIFTIQGFFFTTSRFFVSLFFIFYFSIFLLKEFYTTSTSSYYHQFIIPLDLSIVLLKDVFLINFH